MFDSQPENHTNNSVSLELRKKNSSRNGFVSMYSYLLKWPCVFTILVLRCVVESLKRESENLLELRSGDRSFVAIVFLSVEEQVLLFTGVLISAKRVLSVCHPFVNTTSSSGYVNLASSDHFRVWAGQTNKSGQWRTVERVKCVNFPMLKENDIAILIVNEEFDEPQPFDPLGPIGIMTHDEMRQATTFRKQCQILSWVAKFKTKDNIDLKSSEFKECPAETANISTCSRFFSAEVVDNSSQTLLTGENTACVIPDFTKDEDCSKPPLAGSPVICSKKILGVVTFAKEPALVNTFPVVVTFINFKSFKALSNVSRRTMGCSWKAVASLILNTFLLNKQ